jgi:predicted ATPase
VSGGVHDRRLVRRLEIDPARPPDWSTFPFTLPAVNALRTPLELGPEVTFLVGENGSGKSTLVEGIAAALDLDHEGGDTVLSFVRPHAETALRDHLRVVRGARRPSMRYFLRAESFYGVARAIDETDPAAGALAAYGGRRLHEMSHGESFLATAYERFTPDGIFLLDEPEAALSPQGCLSLLRRMRELALDGGQFIVATHSLLLMAYPEAWIYELDGDGARRVPYEETEHYRLTRSFLEAPERFLRHLFA